jgi:Lrp/AsnC family transcriptional regulator
MNKYRDKIPSMAKKIDEIDRKILAQLQHDASLSVDDISDRVGLSRNACWRRIRAMEAGGVIRGRVVLADPGAVGCPLEVMVLVRTSAHDATWMETFQRTIRAMPEVVGAYRMTGDLDYLLRVRVADVPAYDAFYKRVIARVPLSDISASFVMEEIKETTALPL